MIKNKIIVMVEKERRTRPQLEAVTADESSIVFCRNGTSERSVAPKKSSRVIRAASEPMPEIRIPSYGRRKEEPAPVVVLAAPLRLGEPAEGYHLAKYDVGDLLNELTCSDRPDREY